MQEEARRKNSRRSKKKKRDEEMEKKREGRRSKKQESKRGKKNPEEERSGRRRKKQEASFSSYCPRTEFKMIRGKGYRTLGTRTNLQRRRNKESQFVFQISHTISFLSVLLLFPFSCSFFSRFPLKVEQGRSVPFSSLPFPSILLSSLPCDTSYLSLETRARITRPTTYAVNRPSRFVNICGSDSKISTKTVNPLSRDDVMMTSSDNRYTRVRAVEPRGREQVNCDARQHADERVKKANFSLANQRGNAPEAEEEESKRRGRKEEEGRK